MNKGLLMQWLTCGVCRNYTGAGDWDLCCMANEKRLCYKNTDAIGCKSYKPREETTAKLLEVTDAKK